MRDHYLDTNKAILIFLVVFGHFLERMIGWQDQVNHALLGTIYFIHMPAFILISGMLYKDNKWLKNILFFISLYIPFQILFPVFDALWSGTFRISWNIIERPYWILWYLMGMMVWTLLTHILLKIKHFAFPIAILLSLLIGLSPWNNYQYSIGRIFTFFPFFIFGTLYGKVIFQYLQQLKQLRFIAAFTLFDIFVVVYLSQLNPFWLYGSLSYAQLHVSAWTGIGLRLLFLSISFVGSLALFALVGLIKGRFIALGQHTLPVYLLHGFVVMLIAHYLKLNLNIYVEIGICFLLSILTCWLLQQSIFDRVLRKMSLWLIFPIEQMKQKK